jgi:hypothetical protein
MLYNQQRHLHFFRFLSLSSRLILIVGLVLFMADPGFAGYLAKPLIPYRELEPPAEDGEWSVNLDDARRS